MRTVFVIFRKELTDTLRDRRTLISMIVIPLLLFPLLIGISSRIMMSQIEKAKGKVLRIGLQTSGNAERFRELLLRDAKVRVTTGLSEDSARALITSDSLDAYIVFDRDFDRQVMNLAAGKVTLYFKSAEVRGIEKDRVVKLLNEFERELRTERFARLRIDESVVTTMEIKETNLASAQEKIAEVIGGFLPYIFIIFCFLGSMYPAIDLGAGEKERGTLETLLSSPADRFEILLGKFGVIVLAGILTAMIAMVGLYIGIAQTKEIPAELLKTILGMLQWRTIFLLLSLLLPLTVFFAAALLSLSIFAKSYKEAQSIISPLMIVIIVPVFVGLMPGMNLTTTTALVPILNVSLATKAIIAGKETFLLLAETYLSLIFIAAAGLYVCAKVFGRESTVFRGS